MKKVLFVFVLAAGSLAANAQATFGFKAGANLANIKITGDGVSESFDSKIGFHAGAFATIPVASSINVQPEAVFSMEGAKSGGDKLNLTYINVPVMFQYHSQGFIGETGPQLGLLMSAKSKEEGVSESEDIKEEFETINLSWAVGAGYRLANGLGFHARYNLGLSNLAKDSDDGKAKSNVFQFGLSFALGGSGKK